jgi:hypothetical protein
MIRKNMRQLQSLIKEILLKEGSDDESLAAFIVEGGTSVSIALYDGNALIDEILNTNFEGVKTYPLKES